jgi:predicted solute-binding protein
MAPDVVQRHIQLYVNQYSLDMDDRAVQVMLEWAGAASLK